MLIYLLKLLGYCYLLNKNTGEIHNLFNIKARCGIDKMSKNNKMFLTKSEYDKLIVIGKYNNKKLNGCRYCSPDNDIDNKFK